jgi:hypothetical protein
VWIKTAVVVPGDRAVVHHVLFGSSQRNELSEQNEGSIFENYIGGFAPGSPPTQMPEGTGIYVPAGGSYVFQLHYTPVGKVSLDETRIGFYFFDEPPANFLRNDVVLSPAIRIPPNTKAHAEHAYYEFDKDAVLYQVFPHSHYRGRSSTFEVAYPDGRTELVLSVPNYDFNWQRGYDFVEPMRLPAGSRLIHRTVYDNSAQNPANPDPDRAVPWGLQSFDEMLYGAFSFAWVDETTDKPLHDGHRARVTQMVGFLDQDMDGKVAWEELSPRWQKRMGDTFKQVDSDGNGGLDIDEYVAMQRRQMQRRQQRASEASGG